MVLFAIDRHCVPVLAVDLDPDYTDLLDIDYDCGVFLAAESDSVTLLSIDLVKLRVFSLQERTQLSVCCGTRCQSGLLRETYLSGKTA